MESQLTLTDLVSAVDKAVIQNRSFGPTFILELFKYFVKVNKPGVLAKMWRSERLTWSKVIRKWTSEEEIHTEFVVPNVSHCQVVVLSRKWYLLTKRLCFAGARVC